MGVLAVRVCGDERAGDDLEPQPDVGPSTRRARGIVNDRPAVTRRFGDGGVAGDDGGEDRLVEFGADLGLDFAGEVGRRVVHREEDPADGDIGVQRGGLAYGRKELDQALERIVLALNRDDDGGTCGQGVLGERSKGRRTVDEDGVEGGVGQLSQAVAEDRGRREPLNGEGLEITPCGNSRNARPRRGNQAGRDRIGRERRARRDHLDADAAGGVALGIDVDDEDVAAGQGEGVSEGCGGGRLANAALLIGYRQDGKHGILPWSVF